MARKKKSINELVLNGSFKHNKGRVAQRLKEAKAALNAPQDATPAQVPGPPSHLTKIEKVIWAELASEMDLSTKVNQSRFEMVCRITRKVRQRQANSNEIGQLNGLLQQLKPKVTAPPVPITLPKELGRPGIDRCKNPNVVRRDAESGCGYTDCEYCQKYSWHVLAARYPDRFYDTLIDEFKDKFLAHYPDFDRDDETSRDVVLKRIHKQLEQPAILRLLE